MILGRDAPWPQVMKEDAEQEKRVELPSASALVAGEDYYSEGATIVFTARFLLRRGYCCESGCRHCPYGDLNERNLHQRH